MIFNVLSKTSQMEMQLLSFRSIVIVIEFIGFPKR